MTSPALTLSDLRVVRRGRPVLEIDELTIPAGQLVAIVGQNGSGKSTLLQVVNGLLEAERGMLSVLGRQLHPRTARDIRQRCALVFQDPLLLHETVFDNVALGPRFRGHSKQRVNDQVGQSLRLFRCEHLASRMANALSGGETQRVCLARALVCDPELVMLDEPFTALDSPTRTSLVQELREVAVQRGTTVLLVTHDFGDVLSFAQRAIVLREGRVVQDAAPEEMLRKPADEGVARLVSMDNILPCDVATDRGTTVVTLPNGVAFSVAGDAGTGPVVCCLAGDVLRLSVEAEGTSSVTVEGCITHVAPDVGLHRVGLDCGSMRLVARVPRDRMRSFGVGQRVNVSFDASAVHLVRGESAAASTRLKWV